MTSAPTPRLACCSSLRRTAGKTPITPAASLTSGHDGEYVDPDAIAQDELGEWNDAKTVLRG